jgi:hypothetical protein
MSAPTFTFPSRAERATVTPAKSRSCTPSPPPTQEAIDAAWKRLSPAEDTYMKELSAEVYAAVLKTIEDNARNRTNNNVVVFLRRTLSESALFILKASGYKVRLQIERRSLGNGTLVEHLKPAIVLD